MRVSELAYGQTGEVRLPAAQDGDDAPARPEEQKRWTFLIQPYAVLASIDGDASLGSAGAPVEVDFSDILENLELGGMIHLEAYHHSGWGAILDYSFMDLGSDKVGSAGVVLDAEIFQGILEAFVSRRFELEGETTLDAFAGLRWWDLNLDTSLSPGPVSRSRDIDWVDPVLGAKVATPISGSWSFLARGDIGGFGLESDFTWTADAGVQYRTSKRFAIELHYKALGVDFEEDEGTPRAFGYDTVTHGPVIAFSFFL